jgi:hypothetical protein
MKNKNKKQEVTLTPVTGREFRYFVKNQPDRPQIVCACFEPMKFIGQHNFKNTNYYLLECVSCSCKDKFQPIPYLNQDHSFYAASPEYMRIDHNKEYVPSNKGDGSMVNIPKLEFVIPPDPVFKLVDKGGFHTLEPLDQIDLMKYYQKAS